MVETSNRARTNAPKSYDQLCPLAMALDHIGDRWSMLIIRELLGGPARFSELARSLPGVASNLLTDRLRRLEASGVVTHRAETSSPSYALTELGQALRQPLEALGAWGMRAGPVTDEPPPALRSARSAAMGLESMLRGGQAPPDRMALALRIGDDTLTVELGGADSPSVRAGHPERPTSTVATTMERLHGLTQGDHPSSVFDHLDGRLDATEAFVGCVASGLAELAG